MREPTDSQRSAVYRWEDRVVREFDPGSRRDGSLPLADCDDLVREVWEDYGLRNPPRVTDGRGRRNACGGNGRIRLPIWARSRAIVLHETAHSLLARKGMRHSIAAHGPEFARLLLDLLARYCDVPKAKARRMGVEQRPRRVRFARVADVPQPASREWKAWKAELDRLDGERRLAKRRWEEHRAEEPGPAGR